MMLQKADRATWSEMKIHLAPHGQPGALLAVCGFDGSGKFHLRGSVAGCDHSNETLYVHMGANGVVAA